MPRRKTYHVTPRTDGGWNVKEENASIRPRMIPRTRRPLG